MALQHGSFDPLYIGRLLELVEETKDRWPYIYKRTVDELATIDRNLARPAEAPYGNKAKVHG